MTHHKTLFLSSSSSVSHGGCSVSAPISLFGKGFRKQISRASFFKKAHSFSIQDLRNLGCCKWFLVPSDWLWVQDLVWGPLGRNHETNRRLIQVSNPNRKVFSRRVTPQVNNCSPYVVQQARPNHQQIQRYMGKSMFKDELFRSLILRQGEQDFSLMLCHFPKELPNNNFNSANMRLNYTRIDMRICVLHMYIYLDLSILHIYQFLSLSLWSL